MFSCPFVGVFGNLECETDCRVGFAKSRPLRSSSLNDSNIPLSVPSLNSVLTSRQLVVTSTRYTSTSCAFSSYIILVFESHFLSFNLLTPSITSLSGRFRNHFDHFPFPPNTHLFTFQEKRYCRIVFEFSLHTLLLAKILALTLTSRQVDYT